MPAKLLDFQSRLDAFNIRGLTCPSSAIGIMVAEKLDVLENLIDPNNDGTKVSCDNRMP